MQIKNTDPISLSGCGGEKVCQCYSYSDPGFEKNPLSVLLVV